MKHKSRPQHPRNKSNQRPNVGPIIQDVLRKRKGFMFGPGRYGEWGYNRRRPRKDEEAALRLKSILPDPSVIILDTQENGLAFRDPGPA